MILKFLSALALLLIAFILQFFLASVGFYINLSFAAIISFAMVLGFWEFLALDLLAVFILNWQPAVSATILIIALYPVLVYFLRSISSWQPWFKNLAAVLVGVFIIDFVNTPGRFIFHLPPFFIDAALCMIFAAALFYPLYQKEKW